jgi:hypothetical protein
MSFEPSWGYVGHGGNNVHTVVDGHEAWFSPTNLCLTRLGSVRSVMTARVGGLILYAGVPIFYRHLLVFKRLAIPSFRLSGVSLSSFESSYPYPKCSLRYFVSFPAQVVILCLPPAGAVIYEVFWFPTAASRWSSVTSWYGGGDGSSSMPLRPLAGARRLSQSPCPLPQDRGLDLESRLVSSCLSILAVV